jgi:hypothetical protein
MNKKIKFHEGTSIKQHQGTSHKPQGEQGASHKPAGVGPARKRSARLCHIDKMFLDLGP